MSSLTAPLPFAVKRADAERALLERLASADRDAIASTYTQHHVEVRAFARRMLNDHTIAEDVVHDVFVALPAAVERFRGEAALKTLLMSIAVNICRRHIRSSQRGRRALSRFAEREVVVPPSTPEQEVRRRRLAAALQRGLEELSVDHRETFVLCAIEERSSSEAADILDVPEGTVRSRLFHARAKLRAFLEAEGMQ